MKKVFIGGILVVLALGLIGATKQPPFARLHGESGIDGVAIDVDSAKTAVVDTSFSDTLDLSTVTYSNKVYRGIDLGAVNLCDSCNDSVIIIVTTYVRNSGSSVAKLIYTDTLGGNNITTIDETTSWRVIPVDSLFGNQLYCRTIVKDAITHVYTDTIATSARLLQVPLNIDVLVR